MNFKPAGRPVNGWKNLDGLWNRSRVKNHFADIPDTPETGIGLNEFAQLPEFLASKSLKSAGGERLASLGKNIIQFSLSQWTGIENLTKPDIQKGVDGNLGAFQMLGKN